MSKSEIIVALLVCNVLVAVVVTFPVGKLRAGAFPSSLIMSITMDSLSLIAVTAAALVLTTLATRLLARVKAARIANFCGGLIASSASSLV